MMQRVRDRKRGFTIIELLIVIAIIAILAAVAIPALLKAQKSGKESAATQVLKSLRSAEEVYKTKKTSYGNLNDLSASNSSPVQENATDVNSGYVFKTLTNTSQVFTITATPTAADMTTYTMGEGGQLLQSQ